ncbi:protein of unknown function DUF820 [Acidisarcina polymorpha]|uniref:Putative restriction endonuclease domain-containing protein n=1 Tax=Acidisarcina polymorpha TaxID=2211140 RepID=A0A2Z5FUP0_9BACT|nr:Uma2 family endonuclease [Acidisarcina polymorpha]AXC10217.1 protein of unknown function DUF820 [Acidisarcina polymorpha]
MAAATHISLLEYMHAHYRPDHEFVDGELLERNVGKWDQARIQALLASWFHSQEKIWSVKVATEQRVQVSSTRVRIPDVMLVPRGPQPEIIVDPPILIVEILSTDDTYTDTQIRPADYLNMGTPAVWIIDPGSRTGRQCVGSSWIASERLEVPNTAIWVSLSKLFFELDED